MATTNVSVVKEVLAQAIALQGPDRAAFLDQACAGDAALRAEVEAYLSAFEKNDALLGKGGETADLAVTLPESAGTSVGRYKLLQQIGEGGFGVVFMAEQEFPVRRKVALKIIKLGMDTKQVVARFEAERQALAMMDHPGVARVFDGGATETGRPYFVMELVRGTPITQYCDEHKLTIRQRLELFAQVCQAVQHAHQKGIIHRDIKPSNVLVSTQDDRPAAKVIDFGIAKATQARLTEKTLFTDFRQMIGTPEYMSPEQAEGDLDIDTRTDVYSLGVLLYELLAGSPPFDPKELRSKAFAEMQRIIREVEPPRPSTRVGSAPRTGVAPASRRWAHRRGASVSAEGPQSGPYEDVLRTAAHRRTDVRSLVRTLHGELDWIVMKALEKDRGRRYETANGFASDIQRYLGDEAVLACPPSAAYRLRKFARRNRTALLTGGLVLAALVIGIVVSTWQAIRAVRAEQLAETRLEKETAARNEAVVARAAEAGQRREAERQREQAEANFARARKAVDEYFTLVSESKLFDVPGLQPLRRELLEAALRFYKETANERSNDPGLLADLAVSYLRVCFIDIVLDRNEDALAAARQALDVIDRLLREYPGRTEYHRRLAGFWKGRRAITDKTDIPRDPELAIGTAKRLVDTWARLARENPTVAGFKSDRAAIEMYTAELLNSAGEREQSLQFLQDAQAVLDELVREYPTVAQYRADLADVIDVLRNTLAALGHQQEAEDACRRRFVLLDHLASELPTIPVYRYELLDSLMQMARLLEKRPGQEAEQHLRRAAAIGEKLVADAPRVNYYQSRLVTVYYALARLLGRKGRLAEAESAYDRAIKLGDKLVAQFPDAPARNDVIRAYLEFAELQLARSRPDAAKEFYAKALQLDPAKPTLLNELAWRLATSPVEQFRDPTWAVEYARKAVELAPQDGNNWNTLGVAFYSAGEWKSAIESLEKSTQLRKGGDSWDFLFLAMAHWQLGHKDEARKRYDQAADWMKKNPSQYAELLRFRAEAAGILGIENTDVVLLLDRGNAHAAAGRWDEAAADFSRAVEVDPNDATASFALAIVLLKTGREAEYRRHCHAFLERAAGSREFTVADRAAKVALLWPVDGADFQRACELADFAATATEPRRIVPWMQLVKALAEYRRDRFDSANQWARRVTSANDASPICAAGAWIVQAMTSARLQQIEAAGVAFSRGDQLINHPHGSDSISWRDWIFAEHLRHEAAKLLGIPPTQPATGPATRP